MIVGVPGYPQCEYGCHQLIGLRFEGGPIRGRVLPGLRMASAPGGLYGSEV
ncbi:hypothetical protein ACFCXK_09630 [Streptomyces sp. NPDC056269]|uniref:hypothetical protein n=1 Tax=Streptomyces sp. NPDC056269 TaxID=3345768 RepID=UPI0035DB8DF0